MLSRRRYAVDWPQRRRAQPVALRTRDRRRWIGTEGVRRAMIGTGTRLIGCQIGRRMAARGPGKPSHGGCDRYAGTRRQCPDRTDRERAG